jgi:hypothetical protein
MMGFIPLNSTCLSEPSLSPGLAPGLAVDCRYARRYIIVDVDKFLDSINQNIATYAMI